ncbi:MAG: hypothetical protein CVU95_14325 [Firmicutes bacterium HGW-Firmicutes-2]|nr:MAG: hypothetical protein CVU95_14325 [Firmicutes bacterium HGW-Firmicutes-2]
MAYSQIIRILCLGTNLNPNPNKKGERSMKDIFLDRNKELENEIEEYLCCLHNGAMIFYEGIKDYIHKNDKRFKERVRAVIEHEKEADGHLKNLKFTLYRYNLIPDLSADILELMDAMDDISDVSKQVLLDLDIERPYMEDEFSEDFIEIAKISLKAVEALMGGVRLFFTHVKTIDDYISKVYFYESEVDKLEEVLKTKIFQNSETLDLSQKMHLSYFVKKTAALSDIAEQMAIKLSVFKFKRGI